MRWVVLAPLLSACAAQYPAAGRSQPADPTAPPIQPTPAPASVPAPTPAPELEPEANPEPEPVSNPVRPPAAAEPNAETRPRRRVCNPNELNAVLSTYEIDLELNPRTPKLSDLPDAGPPEAETDGFGFHGPRDLNTDGKPDRVVLYTTVDYWEWLMFEQKPNCELFLGAIPGYRIDVQTTTHHGRRDLIALSYPLQGHLERFEFDGKRYVKR
ncbi:MAG: hypothetical protein R3B13_13450 [Polyangiaceae bacterium]